MPIQDYDVEKRDALRNAALAGLGVTGSFAAAQAYSTLKDEAAENASVRKTRDWRRFLKQLAPGDVVFHRRPGKFSAQADLGPWEMPFKETDVMLATKGDPFYHASVYDGKGKTVEAANWKDGVKRSRLYQGYPEELKVYRPKAPQAGETKAATSYVNKMIGTNYKGDIDVIKHGVTHLFGKGPKTTGKKCAIGPAGLVCTELAAEAYPRIFQDRYASPAAMRHNKGMELVARYGAVAPETLRERLLSRVAYPLLKNAKWGALAAGVGLAGSALATEKE